MLQSDNLLLGMDGQVKITDFGLSKHLAVGGSEAQSTVGSRPYTAPEVLGHGTHDFSADLWYSPSFSSY